MFGQSIEDYFRAYFMDDFDIMEVDNYYLDAPIWILELSYDRFLLFARNNLMTVRDIACHSSEELLHLRNCGKRDVVYIAEQLLTYGIKLRNKDKDDAFLYGYPKEIKRIFDEKGYLWKERFFISVMLVNLDRMRYYRSEELYSGYKIPHREYHPFETSLDEIIKSRADFMLRQMGRFTDSVKFIEGQFSQIREILDSDSTVDNHDAEQADLFIDKVLSVVKTIIDNYRCIVDTKRRVLTDGNYCQVKLSDDEEIFIKYVNDTYEDFDKYHSGLLNKKSVFEKMIRNNSLPEYIDKAEWFPEFRVLKQKIISG